MKDIDEERHGSEAKRQKKDGGRTRRAAGNQGKSQVEEGRAAEDSRRMELWKQKQKPVSLAQGCLPRGEYPAPKRRQQLEPRLPGLSVSTCLPLPPIPPSSPSPSLLAPSFSFSSSSSSTTFRFLLFSFSTRVSSRPRGSLHRWLPPLSLAHRYAESFHANSRRERLR